MSSVDNQAVLPIIVLYDYVGQVWSDPAIYEDEIAAEQFFKVIVQTHGMGAAHTNPHDFIAYHVGNYHRDGCKFDIFDEKKVFKNMAGYYTKCKQCEVAFKSDSEE